MEVLIPLAPFIMVIAIVAFGAWQKDRSTREMQQTLRNSIDKGQPLPPEVIDAMSASMHRPQSAARDMRTGVVLVAVALGIGATALVLGQFADEARYGVGAFAAIPGFIGLAFILLSFFNKNKN